MGAIFRLRLGDDGWNGWLKSRIGRDVTKRAIIDVDSIVSRRNYKCMILRSSITKLLTSRRLERANVFLVYQLTPSGAVKGLTFCYSYKTFFL